MTGFHNLRIRSPYPIKTIEDIRMSCQLNDHGRLYVKGIVDDSIQFQSVLVATGEDEIELYETDGQQENTLFKGLVTGIQTRNSGGTYTIEVEGLSGSFRLDAEEKSRSFQNGGLTYSALLKEIIKEYPSYNVVESVGAGIKVERATFQYKETDWELIKRLASELQSVIVCDILESSPRFYFGLPQGTSHTIPEDQPYTASKNLSAFHRAGGYAAGFHDTDFFYYDIESALKYELGDEIGFRNKRLYVSSMKAAMEGGLLRYTYRLSRLEGIRQEPLPNSRLKGISLEGKVLEVKGEKVRLHLDIDSEQPKSKAHWFPFSPPTGNMMYCMPQVGTHASLYFPDATGDKAMVVGAVRKNGSSNAKTGDPSKRYFGTEHGSELELAPTAINIVGGSKQPLKLSFDDAIGVTMTSHKKLVLNAGEGISLYTPKRIVIQAQSQLMAKKMGALSGFSVEGEYHFLGGNVRVAGTTKTSYTVYNDEPQVGQAPKAEVKQEETTEKKSKFGWGKLLLAAVAVVAVVVVVVAVVAVSVATFGAGAVIGAALLGAAFGAIGGIAGTMASDKANNTQSSLSTYLINAGKGALIGAVCGAIFGPGGGAVTSSLVAQTTRQLVQGIGTAMFSGGAANYTDYVLNEVWDGRTPDGGRAVEAFKNGALFGGIFAAATPWLLKAFGVKQILPPDKNRTGSGKGEKGSPPKPPKTNEGQQWRPSVRVTPALATPQGIKFSMGNRIETKPLPKTSVQKNYIKEMERVEKEAAEKAVKGTGKVSKLSHEEFQELVTLLKGRNLSRDMIKEIKEGCDKGLFAIEKISEGRARYKIDVLGADGKPTTTVYLDEYGKTVSMNWTVGPPGKRGSGYSRAPKVEGHEKGHIKSVYEGSLDNAVEDSPLNIIPQTRPVNDPKVKAFEKYRGDECQGETVITDILDNPPGYVRVRLPGKNIDVTYNPSSTKARDWPNDWFTETGPFD
ncbi:hypothetical protein GK047_28110 [Paenibacillus sp. SYP-B3998]|uniref:Gp5/Type VI secretion system Vgr protein OB-fold domain-containing protein n=1 Tax=Paenibacillus sp. SYP-B3998 TaxID=2678564 RepID=A0A6G4A668_9BACL|nr:hypothetical protein [Paenibacillus sp. SYP-B3998]NEW09788.1 hypothetical protein [Paenibacillus sp. SYP-B3998]